jgi:uncharacterized membrane protein YeaQ/YmgE (transglycosylase-associated protein family)
MPMIVWILLGLGMGLIASKIVSTTGEGTVVDILLGIVGAVVGGWLFSLFGGTGMTGFDISSIYSANAAVIGAVVLRSRQGCDYSIVSVTSTVGGDFGSGRRQPERLLLTGRSWVTIVRGAAVAPASTARARRQPATTVGKTPISRSGRAAGS